MEEDTYEKQDKGTQNLQKKLKEKQVTALFLLKLKDVSSKKLLSKFELASINIKNIWAW